MSKLIKGVIGAVLTVAGFALKASGLGFLVGIGLSMVGSALRPSPRGGPRDASASQLQLGEYPRTAIFGRAATAGSLVDAFNYGGTYGTDWELLIIDLADHRCDALEGFYVNDTYVPFTGDGDVAGYNGQLKVYFRSGTESQALPSIVTTSNPAAGWTANDNGAGVCYVVVAYKADAADAKNPVWSGGRPRFLWVVRGARCYDPRKDSTVAGGAGTHRWNNPATWEWSENPIVCRYNWVRGLYACDRVDQPDQLLIGRGLSAIEAPPEHVAWRANLCDEVVDGAPRYRIGGLVSAAEQFLAVEEAFAAACAGTIIQPEGAVEIDPGEARAPVAHFTDADLIVGSKVRWQDFLGSADADWINTVVPSYVEPSQKWGPHAAPVRRNTPDLIADGGPRELTLSLGMVTNGAQAGRVGEIHRRLGRLTGRGQVTLPPRFAGIEEGDWVTWQSDRYFDGETRTLRVDAWASDEGWKHQLVLRQISSTAYSDTAPLTDGSVATNQAPPPAIAPPAAGSWSAASGYLAGGGIRVPALIVTGASDNSAARFVRVEYVQQAGLPDAATVWSDHGVAGPDVLRREIPAAAGATYYVGVSYVVDGIQGPRRVLGPIVAGQVSYPDGTPIEDLMPGDAGATDGAQTGVNLVNGAGTAVLTDPQIVTAQGTAAAISGQGALATQNNVNLGTQVTGALGTANAAAGLVNANISIAANGSLAGGGGGQVTIGGLGYTGALNATYGARSGTNIYRTDGTTVLSQAEIRTAEGVAASITGQGSLATKNAANWATEITGTGKPENNATNSDNMVRNPTLQSGTGEWTGLSNIARTTPTSTDPGFYWRTTGSGTATANSGALLPLPAGSSTVFVSALVRGSGGNPYWNIACYFYDEANIYLGMGQVNMFTGTGGWNARKATIAIPNRAASYQVVVTGQANGGTSTDLYGLRIAPTELAATLGARLGSNLQNSAATVVLGDADVITAAGVAASIVGQGGLATKNAANWSSEITGTGKPQDNADVTALAQVSVVLTTDQTISATYNGTVTSEDLANIVWAPVVTRGGSSIRTANGTTYALTNASGGTFAVDNTNGSASKGNVTISAMSSNIAQVELTITVDGVAQPKLLLKVTKNLGAPPPPSGGSTPKTVTWGAGEFAALNTTSYTPVVTAAKTVALASGESLYGAAPLTYTVSQGGGATRTMSYKWQYSVPGANSWNDFASPITGTPATAFYAGTPPEYNDSSPGTPGSASVTQTKSGLAAGNWEVRLVGVCSATGRTVITSGTATVEAKV